MQDFFHQPYDMCIIPTKTFKTRLWGWFGASRKSVSPAGWIVGRCWKHRASMKKYTAPKSGPSCFFSQQKVKWWSLKQDKWVNFPRDIFWFVGIISGYTHPHSWHMEPAHDGFQDRKISFRGWFSRVDRCFTEVISVDASEIRRQKPPFGCMIWDDPHL